MSELQEFFDFHPHQFNPFTVQNLQFYHVYDGLSQTPHIPGSGIEAGDRNIYFMRYCHRTVSSVAKRGINENRLRSYLSTSGDNDALLIDT